MAGDPFEDALSELEGDPFEAALAQAAPPPEEGVGKGESAYRGAVQGASLRFGDEVAAAFGAGAYGLAQGVRSYLPGGVPEDAPEVGDVYTQLRDQFRAENAAAEEANPGTYAAGELSGAVAGSGVNPVGAVRAVAAGGRALLTRGGVAAAGRSLLTRETAKAAGAGAAYGGAVGAGGAEENVLEATVEGAATGAVVGGAARGLLAAGQAGQAAQLAKAEGKASAAVAGERDAAVRLTGLDGKQKSLGGPKRAKERAQALYDEPSPRDPSKRLLDDVKDATPDARLEYATQLRREAGQQLGSVRDALAKTEAPVAVAPLRDQIRGAFAELPTEVQTKALEQVDAMIGAVAKDGAINPAALRKLIEDSEGLAKFGTPNLEAALGNARGRVFQSARAVLVQAEKDLVARVIPERVPEYSEALRRYGLYSDFETGSKVILERANKGQKLIRQPARDPKGRSLLGVVAGELGARAGAFVPLPGSTQAGARAGEALVERWGRWTAPNVAALQGKVAKLERLKPMMEEALQKGPAEVARVHALFMQRSPDYRKAFESEE